MPIGLSVSFCIREMVQKGRTDIPVIIAGTRSNNDPQAWDDIISRYREHYWQDSNPDACEALCRRMVAEGRIIEPRNYGSEAMNIAAGAWMHSSGEQFRRLHAEDSEGE